MIIDEFEWRDYGGKHYESIFTRFYQGYLLPEKFNVDKRKLHLSNLVAAGQMSRADALEGLAGIPYPSKADLESDKVYFLKKMGWEEKQLETYLKRPEVPHSAYGSERPLWEFCRKLYNRNG